MKIMKLQNSDKEITINFLMKRAYSSMFLLNNIHQAGLEYTGQLFTGDYWAAFNEAGQILGVLGHFWDSGLMAQAPKQKVLQSLITHFTQNVKRPVAGVVGDSEQAAHILRKLNLQGQAFSINRTEGLYQLSLADMETSAVARNDRLKVIRSSEMEAALLFEWLKAYELEAFGGEASEVYDEYIKGRVEKMTKSDRAWALLDGETPVSLSGFNAVLPKIVQVGPVWTPPEYRNKGYARVLVALTLQAAKQRGVDQSVLFTDNPAAVKAYEAIGFRQNGNFHLALLKKPQDVRLKKSSIQEVN